jgi:hypothetical protein
VLIPTPWRMQQPTKTLRKKDRVPIDVKNTRERVQTYLVHQVHAPNRYSAASSPSHLQFHPWAGHPVRRTRLAGHRLVDYTSSVEAARAAGVVGGGSGVH